MEGQNDTENGTVEPDGILRLRGGRCATGRISDSRRGLLLLSWNIHGIADTEEGESSVKLDDLRCFVDECIQRGEKIAAIALQETWLLDDDEIEVDGYTWYGRNRSRARMEPDAPRGSAGVGWLVADEILARAKVTVERPTYGDCEGFISIVIKKSGVAPLRLVCAYNERARENFKIDEREFVSRVLESADHEDAVLMIDANIRVGCLQETTAEIRRAGEAINSGPIAKHLIETLSENDSGNVIVHGRVCPWDYTFQPVDQTRRSVIDYCIANIDRVADAGVCSREVADVASDHKAIFVRYECAGFSVDGESGEHRHVKRRARRAPYSRRRLRECDPSLVQALVAQLIERRIDAGDIERGQKLDVNWGFIRTALVEAATRCAPAAASKREKGGMRWQPWWNAATRTLREARLAVARDLDPGHTC